MISTGYTSGQVGASTNLGIIPGKLEYQNPDINLGKCGHQSPDGGVNHNRSIYDIELSEGANDLIVGNWWGH